HHPDAVRTARRAQACRAGAADPGRVRRGARPDAGAAPGPVPRRTAQRRAPVRCPGPAARCAVARHPLPLPPPPPSAGPDSPRAPYRAAPHSGGHQYGAPAPQPGAPSPSTPSPPRPSYGQPAPTGPVQDRGPARSGRPSFGMPAGAPLREDSPTPGPTGHGSPSVGAPDGEDPGAGRRPGPGQDPGAEHDPPQDPRPRDHPER